MKLTALLLACALSAADAEQDQVPNPQQISVALGHLYRRFLHTVDPHQLELQDALDMHYSNGMMAGPPHSSTVKVMFEGEERDTFSYITSLVNPGQKSISDDGPWVKQDACDILITHHHGGPMKIHMITPTGIHKEVIVGDPLDEKDAKLIALVPKGVYFIPESLSEERANFHSYISVPAWKQSGSQHFNNHDMEEKFPDFAEMFHDLEKPGVRHRHEHDDRHSARDSHGHDDHGHDDHGHDDHRGGRWKQMMRSHRHH
uniref:Waterborne settlement pheromone-like protein 4 n=1 Tax=Amphibalanus improvisus TaxID=1220549 RepID=A0A4Y5QZQ7_AMPIM|nr:waterborne settlement pheromone-like protein 4 [Amphibalanus improvisus]